MSFYTGTSILKVKPKHREQADVSIEEKGGVGRGEKKSNLIHL